MPRKLPAEPAHGRGGFSRPRSSSPHSNERWAPNNDPLFLLKDGVYLEHKLGLASRATKDVDTLFRGELDEFLHALDGALAEPWGDITLTRSTVSVIETTSRRVKPRRFQIVLSLKGVTWRRIQVEVAFPEGDIADVAERFPAPRLGYFGVHPVAELAGITRAYQVAQKLHACSDPHQPPTWSNNRVRDIVDLLLIRDAFYSPPDRPKTDQSSGRGGLCGQSSRSHGPWTSSTNVAAPYRE